MKQNNRYILVSLVLGLAIIFFVGGCKEKKLFKIEPYLGLKVPDKAIEENFFKAIYSPDYRRPYNIYAKYKISVSDFQNFIKDLGVISFLQDYRKIMCLENVPAYLIPYNLWEFKTHFDYFSRKDFVGLLKWWNPKQDGETTLYAAFYREKGTKKFFKCYTQQADGRILISYNEKNQEAFIMIEVLF